MTKKKIRWMQEHKTARRAPKAMALEVQGGAHFHGRQQWMAMPPASLCYHSLYHVEKAA